MDSHDQSLVPAGQGGTGADDKRVPDPNAQRGGGPAPVAERPLAIRVQDLHKSFRIPTHRVDSLKERAVRPFSARDYRELNALKGVSFDVHKGEFFGIVGRNGSGKSTLLKLLASIYRADSGSIWLAGRMAPFIELGVGFNHELTARENVVLNGVMMGLAPSEARGRLDAVLDFAELRDFVDLKLKNYSSGMLVRLAFSLMLEVDADVLLIDEVLAVGDASFAQKCADAFRQMKAEGKTIVLVTHEMAAVEAYCHRAMLISDGRIQSLGDPAEIARDYLRLNFEEDTAQAVGPPTTTTRESVDFRSAKLLDEEGQPVGGVQSGEPIRLQLELEIAEELPALFIGFILANADGLDVAQFGKFVQADDGTRELSAGQRLHIDVELENLLADGRYFVHCGYQRHGTGNDEWFYTHNAATFVVYGGQGAGGGLVSIPHTVSVAFDE